MSRGRGPLPRAGTSTPTGGGRRSPRVPTASTRSRSSRWRRRSCGATVCRRHRLWRGPGRPGRRRGGRLPGRRRASTRRSAARQRAREGGPGSRHGPTYVRGEGERLPLATGSFEAVVLLPRHRARRRRRRAARRGGPRAGPRRPFLLVVNHPVFQGPGAASSTTRSSTSATGGSAPTSSSSGTLEEVDPDVSLAFSHRPLLALCEPARRARPRPRPSRGALAADRAARTRSTPSSNPPSRACCCDALRAPPVGVRRDGAVPGSPPRDGRIRGEVGVRGRVPDPRGAVGSGALHGGRDLRGLRLVRDRQPAARSRRQDRRAGRPAGAEFDRFCFVAGRGGLEAWRRSSRRSADCGPPGARVRVLFLDASDEVSSAASRAPAGATPSRPRACSSAIQSERARCWRLPRRSRLRHRHERDLERARVAGPTRSSSSRA